MPVLRVPQKEPRAKDGITGVFWVQETLTSSSSELAVQLQDLLV